MGSPSWNEGLSMVHMLLSPREDYYEWKRKVCAREGGREGSSSLLSRKMSLNRFDVSIPWAFLLVQRDNLFSVVGILKNNTYKEHYGHINI